MNAVATVPGPSELLLANEATKTAPAGTNELVRFEKISVASPQPSPSVLAKMFINPPFANGAEVFEEEYISPMPKLMVTLAVAVW